MIAVITFIYISLLSLSLRTIALKLLWSQFVKVVYHQLKYGLQKDENDIGAMREGVSVLLDESWLSSDSFLHHLCKVMPRA